MKKSKQSNSIIHTIILLISGILISIASIYLPETPVLSDILTYLDPSNFKTYFALWMLFTTFIAVHASHAKVSIIRTILFYIGYFIPFIAINFTSLETQELINYGIYAFILMLSSFFVWHGRTNDLKGIIISSIWMILLLYIMNQTQQLNLLGLSIYGCMIILLYKGEKETLLMLLLTMICAIIIISYAPMLI